MTTSIAMARQSIEHLIALCETHADGSMRSICNQAKHGALVLAWLERRQDLMKAVERLDRQRPDLADLLRAFPGAEIVDVRDTFYNGSGALDD
jgi:hypothetical protein